MADRSDWRHQRRQRILEAAGKLFGRAAYADVQMDEIARAAGMGKPTLYRYFASKDELFIEVFGEALRELEARFAEAADRARSPSEALRQMIRLLVTVLADHLGTLRLLSGENTELADRWRRLFRSRRQPIVEMLRGVLEAGIARGEFRAIDPEVVPGLLIGMIRGTVAGARSLSKERLAEIAIDFAFAGLAPAGATAADDRVDAALL